jgi:hypothetical protein
MLVPNYLSIFSAIHAPALSLSASNGQEGKRVLSLPGGVDREVEKGPTAVPVNIEEQYENRIMLGLCQGGNSPLALLWERERGMWSRYYSKRSIIVYPMAKTALRAMGKIVAYYCIGTACFSRPLVAELKSFGKRDGCRPRLDRLCCDGLC